MHKLAIMVEGKTELLLVSRIVQEMANEGHLIILQQQFSGKGLNKKIKTLNAVRPVTNQKFFVQIIDCGGDAAVKQRINDEHENFHRAGFTKVIGIRDVRPDFQQNEIPLLLRGLQFKIKTSLIPVVFILAKMETEAWFLAEYKHFESIDPSITIQKIIDQLGFDPSTEDMTLRHTPTDDLASVYRIGGKRYRKGSQRTIDALDLEHLYAVVSEKILGIRLLTDNIHEFLSLA